MNQQITNTCTLHYFVFSYRAHSHWFCEKIISHIFNMDVMKNIHAHVVTLTLWVMSRSSCGRGSTSWKRATNTTCSWTLESRSGELWYLYVTCLNMKWIMWDIGSPLSPSTVLHLFQMASLSDEVAWLLIWWLIILFWFHTLVLVVKHSPYMKQIQCNSRIHLEGKWCIVTTSVV